MTRRVRVNPAAALLVLGVLALVVAAAAFGALGGVLVAVGSGALVGGVALLTAAWLAAPDVDARELP